MAQIADPEGDARRGATSAPAGAPLVSIIIPCWNGDAFVGEAIDSALSQTYPHVEVIVIDDGSTDGSLDVIRSFGERVRWETGPNRGAGAARNCGLALARGELIQFLDADDLLARNKLERQVPLVPSGERAIVYCGRKTCMIDDPSRSWTDCPSEIDDPVVFAVQKIVATCCPLYRRDWVLEMGGYREGLPCSQDYDFHLRLALAGFRFRRLAEILVEVRRHSASISGDSLRVLRQNRILWREAIAALERRGELTPVRRSAVAGAMASAGRAFVKAGHAREADAFFDEAVAIDPAALCYAYAVPTRLLSRLVGRSGTERLVRLKRRLIDHSVRPS